MNVSITANDHNSAVHNGGLVDELNGMPRSPINPGIEYYILQLLYNPWSVLKEIMKLKNEFDCLKEQN